MNEKIIEQAVSTTKEKWNTDSQLTSDRTEVLEKFGEIFKLKNIDNLTADQLQEFLRFKNNRHWKNIERPGGNLIKNMTKLKNGLKILLDESRPLPERIRDIREENSENLTPHLGMSIYSPILFVAYPEKYPVINEPVAQALHELGLYDIKKWKNDDEWVTIPKMQEIVHSYAKKYEFDLWQIDWVWWEISKEQNQSTQWWIISAGEKDEREKVWNEFRDSNTVGFYWNETGDLSKLTEEQIKEKFKQLGIKKRDKPYDWGSARDILRIKKNDILFVKEGKRGFYAIGKATDTYQYNTNQSYHHTIPIQWITTQHYDTTGKDVPLQLNSTLTIIPNKSKKGEILKYYNMSTNGNYFIITSYPDSKYSDKEGKEYEFPSHIQNAKLFVSGTHFIVQTRINDQNHFVGYGKVKEIIKKQGLNEKGKSVTMCTANYSQYREFFTPKLRTSEIKDKMQRIAFPNTGKGSQIPSMLEITHSLYREILGEDLTSEEKKIDTMTEHSRTIDILKRKKNIILYGPPGTGKTYTAKKIAKKLIDTNIPDTALCFTTDQGIDKIRRFQEFLKNHDNKLLWGAGWSPTQIDASNFPITGFIYYKSEIIALAHITQITADDKTTEDEQKLRPERETYDADYKSYLHIDGLELCKPFPHTELKLIDKTKTMPERVQQFVYVGDFSKFINIVTFHQSYGYEEFIEGIRPEVKNKVLSYPIKKGIFQKICNQARTSKDNYVLIIDEINRGNISKIFGELITIIENDKRGDKVTLAYSDDQFSVPDNVYIIGTMNTADQSLTHIDAALKRRFSSIEVIPDSSILKKGMKGLPELLDKINEKVREKISRDNQIGHSYFMQDEKPITEIKELQFVFATDIIPLLRDYFYDSDDDLKEVLGEQFIDWNEGSDRNVEEDWQNDPETFRTAIKEAYDVTI